MPAPSPFDYAIVRGASPNEKSDQRGGIPFAAPGALGFDWRDCRA
jgi:hypothetical protein